MKEEESKKKKRYCAPNIELHKISLEEGLAALSNIEPTDLDGKIYEQREVDVDIDGTYTW